MQLQERAYMGLSLWAAHHLHCQPSPGRRAPQPGSGLWPETFCLAGAHLLAPHGHLQHELQQK